jgi:CheY-like chemotaxis protein
METVLLVGETADAEGLDGASVPVSGDLRRALERVGYTVLQAEDGAAALGRLSTLLPDLLLVSGSLGDMDALELCARVRRDSTTERIPIVLVADSSPAMVQRGAHAGVDMMFPAWMSAAGVAKRLRQYF